MNESFIVYNVSAILNRMSEFLATLTYTETMYFNIHFERQVVVETTLRSLIFNVTMTYDVMKIKLATK